MKLIGIFIVISFIILFGNIGCKNSSSPTESQQKDTTSYIDIRKPNIYIYPSEDISIKITINFPAGGSITDSDPEYRNGWNVFVSSEGKINGLYDYLFYECRTPDLTQKEYGWIVKKNDLENFFKANLSESNFNNNEISDFINYWIPRLKEYNYYEIYPQYISTMKKMTIITFSPNPNNEFRLIYDIKGRSDNAIKLKTPIVEKANRKGYFTIEWGVVLK